MLNSKETRKIDFTQRELMDMTDLSRKQLYDSLKKICEMYGFDISAFKSDKLNKNSSYSFPIDIVELLALLLRHLHEHPMNRANADVFKISAKAVEQYNNMLINDINTKLHDTIKDLIYCRPAHLVSQEITDWVAPLVKQLTYFLVNITTLSNEDIGATLSYFTKKLDTMNYCLFRGNYAINQIKQANTEYTKTEFGEYEDEEYSNINELLNKQNRSLDLIIADMIKWELINLNNLHDEMSSERSNLSKEKLRDNYYRHFIMSQIDTAILQNNLFVMNHYKEKTNEWCNTEDQIKKGIFYEPTEKPIEELKQTLEKNILMAENEIQEYKKLLTELCNEPGKSERENLFLQQLKLDYVKHCNMLDSKYKKIYEIVDLFVGRTLVEFMK